MSAGRLLHVLTVQRVAVTPDAAGTPVEVWADLATLRADLVKDDNGEAIRAGGGVNDTARLQFKVRYVAGITLADRVLFRGEPWNIKAIEEIGRRSRYLLSCEAGP